MDRRLTDRQRRALEFIASYSEANEMSPSMSEIGAAMDGISPTAALAHVVALEKKGYVRRDPHRARGIEVISRPGEREVKPNLYKLPVVGEIAAGQPIEAYEEHTEFLWVEAGLARSPRNFILRVRGHSMIGDGINDGDFVLVQPQNTAENGETVVALVGTGATLKRLYRERGHIRLQPANPYLEPMIVSDVAIQGKVVALVRRYE
ncbi:MAG: transcriptional repressor LexA [Chloroflexi bacterium]|nr:transcriptional repressor LexA [Chloroflexota bacterium]